VASRYSRCPGTRSRKRQTLSLNLQVSTGRALRVVALDVRHRQRRDQQAYPPSIFRHCATCAGNGADLMLFCDGAKSNESPAVAG
jgi:hypothetical protein